MTNKEILEKAIHKAIDGGWVTNLSVYPYKAEENFVIIHYLEEDADVHAYEIIFGHDFAKALWGNEEDWELEEAPHKTGHNLERWEYHLQQMVIADDPLAYLGENI